MDPPTPGDSFVWPGEEGFKDFPKNLSEDCVEYTVHVINSNLTSDAQVRTRLKQIRDGANELVKKHLSSYIWQRDGFNLELVAQSGGGWLQGKTSYGDSIADEWLIVYLLKELSMGFEDAWVRVSDADGEFLLIEAANVLPRWLNPEVAEHRVWINKAKLKIIPMQKKSLNSKKSSSAMRELTLKQALSFLSNNPSQLTHSPQIEAEAFFRLRNYPAQIKESLHTARITVPRNLAYIIHTMPANISPAVEAFYLRDPVSTKPLQTNSDESLTFRPKDLVTVSTIFTRVGYAQLKSQDFPAPRAWSSVKRSSNDEEMGMRVSCAFEMLLADPQNLDKRSVREINLLLEDLENGEPLPTDSEIGRWASNEDDEKWLDVNFEDLERELRGGKGASRSTDAAGQFGDAYAQENLRKIVEKFEQFLNDDDAGAEGAEFGDEMDYDDDDDDDEDDDEIDTLSDGEDCDASFDEEEFANAMREMMGLPQEPANAANGGASLGRSRVEELESSDDEALQVKELSQHMEAELKELGALNLDHSNASMITPGGISTYHAEEINHEQASEYQLAKNFLESFKSQVGVAGPAGNMISMMGMKLPRDENTDK